MSVSDAIIAVEKISDGLVALPGSEEYNNLTSSYFTELEREIKPACFITPNSTAQVAAVVKAIRPFAKPSMLAICGAAPGIQIDADRRIVSVAAGERMGNVYDEVVAAGLGVVGNRHSSGGIGGDAVQGGLSYFSYEQGFICDNVVNYEIVLASGEVANANADTNRDLWVALKGGANNFGIVTRFDLRAFPQGRLWGGKVFYFQPSFSGQIGSLVEYLKDPNPDVDIHICLSLGYAPAMGDLLAMNDIFCTKPEKPKALEPFSDVQPQIEQMKTLRVDSLKALTDEAFSGVENLLFSITFEPIPVSLIEQSIARGRDGNSLGLKPSDGPLVVVLLYTSWDKSSDDEKVYEVNKEALQIIEAKAVDTNLYLPYLYMNYAFPHQDPITAYGSESKANLQAGFFQTSGVGPWKILK
ncbi:hypothetical protein F4801DRAFT_592358 [Xylaria longipes]|nr:hypothetical protein F4801DRAFT_592358 [Xylaria longipes]